MKENLIATINNVAIVVIDDSQKMVPIRPICDALGIDYSRQFSKLKEDEFLSSTIGLRPTVAADGKEREMTCIPYQFVFGWLFTINPQNVKEEARETVAKYRIECYNALYNYFTEPNRFLSDKQKMIEAKLREFDHAKDAFKFAKNILEEKRKEFDVARYITIEEWREQADQKSFDWAEE